MNYLAKEAPLQDSIAKMNTALNSINCDIEFKDMHSPIDSCYWVNLALKGASGYIYSNGKGSCKDACIASALGEFIERVQTNNYFSEFYLQNSKFYPDERVFELNDSGYLNSKLLEIYNPSSELAPQDLIDFNSNKLEQIVTLPFVNEFTKELCYIPVAILNNLYVSNGLATGNTKLEAKVQALSEIIERYTKIEIIKNGYALPEIPKEIVASFTKINDSLDKLEEFGYKVKVLDASLGGKFPVVAISLINPKNGGLFVSFGSHPQLEVALERTFTELLQGRRLNSLDNFEIPTLNLEEVRSSLNIESHFIDSNGRVSLEFLSSKKSFEYANFSYNGTTIEDEYNYLSMIIKKQKKELYVREYDYLGFNSCQIIVPDFSEIYPVEDLVYNNQNVGKWVRDIVLNFKEYEANEILEALEHIDDSIDAASYIGVIFKEPFSFGELKAQACILENNLEEAIYYLEPFANTTLKKVVLELARLDLQELDFADYKEALETLFAKESVDSAKDIISGKKYLISCEFANEYIEILKLYKKLEGMKQCIKA